MADSFAPGDVVRLKSGGPAMTIARREAQPVETWLAVWFAGDELKSEFFPAVTLTAVTAPE